MDVCTICGKQVLRRRRDAYRKVADIQRRTGTLLDIYECWDETHGQHYHVGKGRLTRLLREETHNGCDDDADVSQEVEYKKGEHHATV